MDSNNCRLYLGAVKRRSKGWQRDFSELAGRIAIAALKNVYLHLEFQWDGMQLSEWSGRGSGVEMWRDFYHVGNIVVDDMTACPECPVDIWEM